MPALNGLYEQARPGRSATRSQMGTAALPTVRLRLIGNAIKAEMASYYWLMNVHENGDVVIRVINMWKVGWNILNNRHWWRWTPNIPYVCRCCSRVEYRRQ